MNLEGRRDRELEEGLTEETVEAEVIDYEEEQIESETEVNELKDTQKKHGCGSGERRNTPAHDENVLFSSSEATYGK